MEPIEKIRNILFDELDLVRKKDGDTKRAKAVSGLAAQAVYAIRVEVENKKIELDIGQADKEVKTWMNKDFTKISKG